MATPLHLQVRNFTDEEMGVAAQPPQIAVAADESEWTVRMLAFRGIDLMRLFEFTLTGSLDSVCAQMGIRALRRDTVRTEIYDADGVLVRLWDKRTPQAQVAWRQRTGAEA